MKEKSEMREKLKGKSGKILEGKSGVLGEKMVEFGGKITPKKGGFGEKKEEKCGEK